MPLLERKRLFFAAELPESIKEYLSSIQNLLIESGADLKYTQRKNIHITVKFLGNTQDDILEDMKNEISRSFLKIKKFSINLEEVGAFPSIKSPRIIWAGFIDKHAILNKIYTISEDVFEGFGFKKESRPFKSHATIARVRSDMNKTALIEKLKEADKNLIQHALQINKLTLFESKLTPAGPEYFPLQEIELS